MKKKFRMLVVMMAMLVMIPLGVKAAAGEMSFNCNEVSDGVRSCSISYDVGTEAIDTAEITLTQKGGAEIQEVTAVSGSGWDIDGVPSNTNGVWTVKLSNINKVSNEQTFVNVTYKESGQQDCGVEVSLLGSTKTIEETPSQEKTPTGKCVYDKNTEKYYINGEEVTKEEYQNACPKTGSTLPYIALASIALIATGAYVATKNKAKMFRI